MVEAVGQALGLPLLPRMRIVGRVVGKDGILAEARCPLLVEDGVPREDVPEGVAC